MARFLQHLESHISQLDAYYFGNYVGHDENGFERGSCLVLSIGAMSLATKCDADDAQLSSCFAHLNISRGLPNISSSYLQARFQEDFLLKVDNKAGGDIDNPSHFSVNGSTVPEILNQSVEQPITLSAIRHPMLMRKIHAQLRQHAGESCRLLRKYTSLSLRSLNHS